MTVRTRVTSVDVAGFPAPVEWYELAAKGGAEPVVVLLHGRDGPDGVAGDRGYRDLAAAFAQAGFRVAFPRYFERTAAVGGPAAGELDAVGREIESFGLWVEVVGHVLRTAGGDDRVGLVGYSLGGYLALTAAMTRRDVGAVVACYAGRPTPFVGLAANLPPTLVLHGALDPIIPVAEARALAALLRRKRVEHELHVYQDAGHGFTGPDAVDAVVRGVRFLRPRLRTPRPPGDTRGGA